MGGTKILLLLVKVALHSEGILGKMFGDKTCRQARPRREVAVVDGGNEGRLDGAEGCCVEVLGKFALGGVMAENAVCLVHMGAP